MTDAEQHSPYRTDALQAGWSSSVTFSNRDELQLHVLHWPARTPSAGAPVLLLHGFTNDAHIWDPLSQQLSEHHDVFALDFRGHGASAWDPEGRYLHQSLVTDLIDCIDHLQLQRPHLIGHSLGARIAMLAAGQSGIPISSLCILDTGPDVRAAGVRKVRRDAEATPAHFVSTQAYQAWLAQVYMLSDTHAIAHMARHGLREGPAGWQPNTDPAFTRALWKPESYQGSSHDLVAPLNEQLWQALTHIHAPTLLLRGQISAILSRDTARRMVEDSLPRAELQVIPRAGHALMCDNPSHSIQAITDFIRRIETSVL